MLNRIIDWAVRNRLLVVLALLAALAGSVLLLPQLNLDAFPDVTSIQVQINTAARGLAAEEVEQLITYPIEAVMYALPDVEEVRSISKTGLSVITVVFREGTDIYFARQLVFERLQAARERIPAGVGTPEMGPNTSGLGQVYQYLLFAEDSGRYDALALRSLNDWVAKLLLMPVAGVTDVLSFGGEVRQYQVQIDPQRLLAYGLSIDRVARAIEANNRNAGGWYLDRGAEQLVIRGVGWVRSGEDGLRDIANVPLEEVDGVTVHVRDVAAVGFGPEIRQGAVTMTRRDDAGRPQPLGEVVVGIVLKRLGANTRATIEGVKRRLPAIRQALPDGVSIEPFYDQAELVDQAVRTVTRALLEAFALIVVTLMLFLMNLRAALLVLLSVPVSIGLALMAMAHWGLSANLMSLGGLAIAIGMMVDGSVVMMEYIFSRLADHEMADDPSAIPLVIQESAREMGRPVFFAVMIIIIVFAPLFTLQGVEGRLFQPMAQSIVLAMLASLLVAMVVVPALASFVFRDRVSHRPSPLMVPLAALYRRTLSRALGRRGGIAATAFVLFAVAIALLPRLGTEFVPELEEGTLNIRVTLAPSSSLDTALVVGEKLEAQLLALPEVTYASSRAGRAELGGDPEPVSNIEIFVGLKPVKDWSSASDRESLQAVMEERLSVHPGLRFSFSQPIATRVDELLSGVKAQLAIKLFGPDLDILAAKGREIEVLARSVEGTRDVAMEQITGEAQLVIRPERDALARYGMPVSQIMDLVSDAIGGREAGQVIRGNERYDISVRLTREARNSADSIRSLILEAPNGAWVRLGDVARVTIESGPPQIRRDDVQRRVVIQANVTGRDMGGLVHELRDRINAEIDLPAGYSVVFGGDFHNQQRAQSRLMVVVPLSLGLIFLMLYFAFHSVGQALLVMINVPLALIGGVAALFFSGQYLSVPGSIGFIALFGVAVLNGVVMVAAINQRVGGGTPLEKAVFTGALSRLRPVLMTAGIAALGLIPMLLSSGVGSEVQRPLATVVVGGLFSSTLLTLFVLPVLYAPFSKGVIADSGNSVK
ncbi:MAG: CusA/CzcA family heavy metal efflux RND transporter [Gammaproteobacteria bacterium]|jgi:cobalt-zinc-cadmium resistance protein CzcA